MDAKELKAIISEVIEEINIDYSMASRKDRERIDFASSILALILAKIK